MTLADFKSLLSKFADARLQLRLPDGDAVPMSFHITEVALMDKTFIDCGGTMRREQTCQLQAWVGDDEDHRLAVGKLSGILRKAATFLPDETVPVEIEYEQGLISQYPIAGVELRGDALIFVLEEKHTDCLAKEICLPLPAADSGCGCGPKGCC
jgi:hypothetical protein